MLRSELLRPHSSAAVCSTCLATDRQLHSLQETPLYVDICNGLTLSKIQMVCFECRARLHNMFRFRYRAIQAQSVLSPKNRHYFVKNLSSLTQTVISPKDTIFIDSENDDLLQVKEEIPESVVTTDPIEGPLFVSTDDKLKEEEHQVHDEDSTFDTKSGPGDDDSKTDTASENGGEQPQTKPKSLVTEEILDFVVKPIKHREILAYLERERNSKRYKRAPYKCTKCAVIFNDEKNFKRHNLRHSEKQGRYKCQVCEQRFKEDAALKVHVSEHYRRFECRQCDRVEYIYSKMRYHFTNAHDATPRFCRHCPARFTSNAELKAHKRSKHGSKHACNKCGAVFSANVELQKHITRKHTKVERVECKICHKKYKGADNLQKHTRYAHDGDPKEQPNENAYCAECNLQFKDVYKYRFHLRHTSRHVTSDSFKYECDHCRKRFVQKQNIRHHIELMHLKRFVHKCDKCDQSFPTALYMTRHKRLKHSDKPRQKKDVCHICGKAFTIRKSLDQHMNTHLGLRPYVCKHCGATFAYSAALYTHNRLVHLKRKRGKHGDT